MKYKDIYIIYKYVKQQMNIQTRIGVWCKFSSFIYFILFHFLYILFHNYTGDKGGRIPDSGLGPIISPGVGGRGMFHIPLAFHFYNY